MHRKILGSVTWSERRLENGELEITNVNTHPAEEVNMVHTGCVIDNTGGNYRGDEILDKLSELAHDLGALDRASEIMGAHAEACEELTATGELDENIGQMEYETEEELIGVINDKLQDQGLVLTVGEVNPGDYVIERLED